MSSYIAQPASRKYIRGVTGLIRNYFGHSDKRCFPIVHFLELELGRLDDDYNYEIVPVSEMPTDYAITYPEQNKIVVREDVYLRAIAGVPRDRFTIAHEIGHLIMHRPGILALARNSQKVIIPAYKNPEWQANTFAGELLAPPHIIVGLSAAEVSKYCGVSLAVAEIQLKRI